MYKSLSFILPMCLALSTTAFAEAESHIESPATKKVVSRSTNAFTGRVTGKNVRMRALPDLESHIVSELDKGELLVIRGEKGDFYAVEPPTDIKAYIFRSFVLDNVVEGDRVNIRLSPDKEAPIVGHVSTGTSISGSICKKNNKWLEIDMPNSTNFYIAKELVEYAGKPELKKIQDNRKRTVLKLMESAELLTQAEMRKPFQEIDIERISSNYKTILEDYSDFTAHAEKAKSSLAALQESYLLRKISFLENKSDYSKETPVEREERIATNSRVMSPTDRMKIWEPLEESLYLSWSAMHHAKTMDDFYVDQKLRSATITGMLEAFAEPVKSKPGDYIISENNVPIAYVYSTHVNLDNFTGKKVTLSVCERDNNNFAFPAYYVLDAE